MTRKPHFDLTEAIGDSISSQSAVTAQEIAAKPAPKPVKPPKGPRGAARPNARGVTVYVEQEVWTTLKMICLEEGKTTQDVVEALIVARCKRHK